MTWLRKGIAALRVRQWLHFTVLPAAALGHGAAARGELEVARGALIAAFGLAYAYGLNAITDRATDDRRKNPLSGDPSVPPAVAAAVVACGLVALALAASGSLVACVAALVCVLAGTAYSAGPRLKAIPVVGTLTNVAIFAPLLAVGLGEAPRPAAFDALAWAFVASLLQNQLLHELADADEDRRASVVTTARLLGPRGTSAAVALLGLGGASGGALLSASAAQAIAVVLLFGATTLAAFARGWAPDARRRRHRWIGLTGGGVVFAAAWIGAA